MKWRYAVLLGAVLLLGTPVEAKAAPQITIQVTDKTPGRVPGDKITVMLEPESRECPMPAESLDGVCAMRFDGSGAFMPMEFETNGIFDYRLYEVPGQDSGTEYDSTVYERSVYVTEDGEKQTASMVAKRSQDGKKVDEFHFQNRSKPTVPRTGDSGNWVIWLSLSVTALLGAAVLLCCRKFA